MRLIAIAISVYLGGCTHRPASDGVRPSAVPVERLAAIGSGINKPLMASQAWTISEFIQRREEVELGATVSVHGVLLSAHFCPPCPANVACAPCASVFGLAQSANAPRSETVMLVGGVFEGDFTLTPGRHYEMTGRLDSWGTTANFAQLYYQAHRALD